MPLHQFIPAHSDELARCVEPTTRPEDEYKTYCGLPRDSSVHWVESRESDAVPAMIIAMGRLRGRTDPHGNEPQIRDQPMPVIRTGSVVIQDLVIADIEERRRVGTERYGTPLQPHNGRDALVDAYQEALDLCQYLRQAIYERDNPWPDRELGEYERELTRPGHVPGEYLGTDDGVTPELAMDQREFDRRMAEEGARTAPAIE